MFNSIKTSEANKTIVTELTRKFELGTENLIARIALAYSLQSGRKLNLTQAKDSRGKEYSSQVLFGSYAAFYLAMVCCHYQIDSYNKDLAKYVKMHLDDGLEMINADITDNPNLTGFDYLLDKIGNGLKEICEEGS